MPSPYFENYIDDEEGFAVEAENDVVTRVCYGAKAEEGALCPRSGEPTYIWSISAGTIVSGQGTLSVLVNTKGIADGAEITATLTVGGIPVECSSLVSCTTKVQSYRIGVK